MRYWRSGHPAATASSPPSTTSVKKNRVEVLKVGTSSSKRFDRAVRHVKAVGEDELLQVEACSSDRLNPAVRVVTDGQ